MTLQPTDLKLINPALLQVTWSDGACHKLTARMLRDHCPCASCREKQRGSDAGPNLLPVLSPEETVPLRIQGMTPVGHYAYAVSFSDGHDTGIYTLENLRSLGVAAEQDEAGGRFPRR